MRFRRHFFLACLTLFAGQTGASVSATIESAVLKHIEDLRQTYHEQGLLLSHDINPIDPRLNLAACAPELMKVERLNDPLKFASTRFEVSCEDTERWKLYVSARLVIEGPVVVAKQTLGRNVVLSEPLLETQLTQINQPGYQGYQDIQQIHGMLTKRAIRQGQMIQPHMLKPPLLVRRGERVIIEARGQSIQVRMTGLALSDGQLGQEIAVKNEKSNRIVKAKVISKGVTQVTI